MSAAHTPGPWRVSSASLDGFSPVMAPGGTIVAMISNLTGKTSDARLIAAAPDLLEALEYAVDKYGAPGGPWNVPSDPGGWLDRARAALAKARGQ